MSRSTGGYAERNDLGSVDDVRATINDEVPQDPDTPDTGVVHAIPKETIKRGLTAGRVAADSEASGGPTESQLREATIAVAAERVMGYDSVVKKIKGGDESVSFDTKALHSRLESNADRALSHVQRFYFNAV